MRRARAPKPLKRDGTWYLIQRVPKEFAELDRRVLVRISTGIAVADDPRAVRAGEIVKQLGRELAAYWRGLADGKSGEARLRFEAAQKRARAIGLVYQTNQELADGSIEELVARIRMLVDRNAVDDESVVAAIMGGEERPVIRVSELVAEVEKREATYLATLSPAQLKRWKLDRNRACDRLKKLITDKEITKITRADALKYQEWWQQRVTVDGKDINTANKEIGQISHMLKIVNKAHHLELGPVFAGLRLSGESYTQRSAFDLDFVQATLFADGALDDMNEEARRIIFVIAETGLRLSEAANLLPEHIKLDHAVPHVQIRAVGRRLKTEQSERDIPLVGCALAAMKLQPNGFPRYHDKANSLSAAVNKFLRENGLLPSDNHSLYSLRHTFEDRLTAVEAPEKVIASLMGHKWIRPKYGAGPTLEQKRRWLQKIAFKPPKHL